MAKNTKIKKNPDVSLGTYVIIGISFSLAILDMILLYGKFVELMNMTNAFAMLTAFIIATAANFIALTWERQNGQNLAKHAINKESLGTFISWALIGVGYAVVRITSICKNMSDPNYSTQVIGDVIQIGILAISYIGTGVLIESSACKIWDAECVAYRADKKKYDAIHAQVTDQIADLEENIGILEKFERNYKTLDNQTAKVEDAIRKSEIGVMSDIVGHTCTQNPSISPSEANKVMDDVLERSGHSKSDSTIKAVLE